MKVKEMHQIVMDLVGLEFMPEDSGIVYDNEKEVYSGNCYVNTVIFRGRIYDEFKKVGQDGIKFSRQLNNGKERAAAAETLRAQAKSRANLGEYNNTNCS